MKTLVRLAISRFLSVSFVRSHPSARTASAVRSGDNSGGAHLALNGRPTIVCIGRVPDITISLKVLIEEAAACSGNR